MTSIITEIDAQIAKLQEARRILETLSTTEVVAKKSGRGRPKGSKNAPSTTKAEASTTAAPRKRKLSPEGRTRIAEAMKRRWAERKAAK